ERQVPDGAHLINWTKRHDSAARAGTVLPPEGTMRLHSQKRHCGQVISRILRDRLRSRGTVPRLTSFPGCISRFVQRRNVGRFTIMRFSSALTGRKMRFIPLVAATFFMVSGGPYAIEDILGGAGFARAIIILLLLPFLWSLPAALMIGELASAIPAEGGFYIWVRRAMGPFWGYQEGWLSLSASVFDMALYPAIFVLYLGKFSPALTAGWKGFAWSLAVVVLCCAWNLRGAPAVGEDSVGLFALLLAPFAVFGALGFWRWFTVHPQVQWGISTAGPAGGHWAGPGFSTAVLVAMW